MFKLKDAKCDENFVNKSDAYRFLFEKLINPVKIVKTNQNFKELAKLQNYRAHEKQLLNNTNIKQIRENSVECRKVSTDLGYNSVTEHSVKGNLVERNSELDQERENAFLDDHHRVGFAEATPFEWFKNDKLDVRSRHGSFDLSELQEP